MSFFHRTHVCKFLTIFARLEPTVIGGELWIACEGTGVSTGGRAHSLLFLLWCGPRSPTRVQVCANAWLRACQATDRDLDFQRHSKSECLDV